MVPHGVSGPPIRRETKDPTADEEFGTSAEDEDEADPAPEPEPKQRNVFPASMGLSVFLPAKAGDDDSVQVTVTFAEYVREERETGDGKKKRTVWRRMVQAPRTVMLPLEEDAVNKGHALPDTAGIRVCGKLESADAPGLEAGTRALSVFVVNERTPGEKGHADEQFIFQVEMQVALARGFVPRLNRQGEGSTDEDDETSDLQFRNHCEWAVGHGVVVEAPIKETENKLAKTIRTTWIVGRCTIYK